MKVQQRKRIDGVVAVIDAIRVASLVSPEPDAAEDPVLVFAQGWQHELETIQATPGKHA